MYIKTSKPIIKIKYGLAAEDSLMIEDAEALARVRTQAHKHTHTESHCSFTLQSTKFILCITFLSGLTLLCANNFFLTFTEYI